jgi:hypothetical protein
MQSKNRYSFLIVSLLLVALFYSTNMFHSAVALSTHDIMALNANAQVLASRVSLSMDNDTELKDISNTNDTDSDSNNSDPFSTKDNGKIDKDSQIVIDEDQDKRDQRNKSSTTKNIVDSCEEDDKRCRNVQDVLRSQDNSENEEDDKDVSDQDTNNEEGAETDEDSDNESDEKKSSDKFELPIDIPFP